MPSSVVACVFRAFGDVTTCARLACLTRTFRDAHREAFGVVAVASYQYEAHAPRLKLTPDRPDAQTFVVPRFFFQEYEDAGTEHCERRLEVLLSTPKRPFVRDATCFVRSGGDAILRLLAAADLWNFTLHVGCTSTCLSLYGYGCRCPQGPTRDRAARVAAALRIRNGAWLHTQAAGRVLIDTPRAVFVDGNTLDRANMTV
jgi:hypothetical protein